jgi:hypothetical protein
VATCCSALVEDVGSLSQAGPNNAWMAVGRHRLQGGPRPGCTDDLPGHPGRGTAPQRNVVDTPGHEHGHHQGGWVWPATRSRPPMAGLCRHRAAAPVSAQPGHAVGSRPTGRWRSRPQSRARRCVGRVAGLWPRARSASLQSLRDPRRARTRAEPCRRGLSALGSVPKRCIMLSAQRSASSCCKLGGISCFSSLRLRSTSDSCL